MKKRSSIEKGRERLRLQQSYNIIGRYAMDLALDRGIFGSIRRFFLEKLYNVPQLTRKMTVPEKVRYLLQDLGPIYVKVGQLVSSQSQALPPEWAEEMDKLQSNVRPVSYELVEAQVISELGSPPDELYATFDYEPLAAASLAQVHRATLKTGEQVVAKIQRPNIQNQVKADVGIMDWLAGLAEQRSGWARDMGLIGVVNEFGRQVLLELNYSNEAYNAVRLDNNLADIEGIRVPVIHAGLSTDRLLTMEYVDGFKITDLVAIEAAGIDREHLATVALRATIKQILIDGFFHGDLHPGNVLVNRADGDIVLLDTGMVGELDLNQRFNLIGVLLALYQQDVRGLALNVRSLSKPFKPVVDDKAYEKQFERQIGRLMQMPNTDFSTVINSVMEVQRDNGLAFDPSLTLAIKSIMQMETISSILFSGSGLLDQGLATTLELVREQITEENITNVVKKQASYTVREVAQRLPSLQEATLSWLTQYEKGRLEVFHDMSDLDDSVAEGGRLLRQLIIGILLTGIIVGSAIATGIAAAFDLEASTIFTTIAFVGYIAATLFAGLFILGLLWRLWRSKPGPR